MKIKTALLFFLICICIYAQDINKIGKAFDDLSDAIVENEDGKLTLYFTDALKGFPIKDAKVTIDGIGVFPTDAMGRARFPIPKDGAYSFSVEATKYITSSFKINVEAGTFFENNRFSISPMMEIGFLRVVVDWSSSPKDLDAHLVKGNEYHISFRNTRVLSDGTGMLDRDDMDGYGPETITINNVSPNSVYTYFVHNYSDQSDANNDNLSKSKACVKVYGDGKLLNVFNVNPKQIGNKWMVFKIVNGYVQEINQITN